MWTILLTAALATPQDPTPSAPVLWYAAPAASWSEALPVGNGRLGAMVFGRTDEERIQLNEETLWSGGPYDQTRRSRALALQRPIEADGSEPKEQ